MPADVAMFRATCDTVQLTSSNEKQQASHDVDEPGNVGDLLSPAEQASNVSVPALNRNLGDDAR